MDKCVPHEDGHIGVGESGGHMGSSSFLELYTIFCSDRERKLEHFFLIIKRYQSSGKITIGRIKHRKIINNSATQKQSQSQNEILPVC